MLLEGEIKDGDTIQVGAEDGVLVINGKPIGSKKPKLEIVE